jgi:hypothetical protein
VDAAGPGGGAGRLADLSWTRPIRKISPWLSAPGSVRANYGEQVIKNVSKVLTIEFGKGFSERSVRQYRQFYQMFPKFPIRRSMIAKLQKICSIRSVGPIFSV